MEDRKGGGRMEEGKMRKTVERNKRKEEKQYKEEKERETSPQKLNVH